MTLTCTVDDPAGDRVNAPMEGGSRDDGPLVRTITVDVVPSYWSASDKEIGYHPKRDANNNIIEPHEWLPDGRMTAPLDQTVANPATEKSVAPGESVPCAVEAAQDWDTLTTKDGQSIAQDDTLIYTWTADKGKFRVTHDDGTTTDESTATGTSATWIAPDDVTEDTDAQVKCTIDDAPGDRVTAPIGGSHDDDKLERTAKIKVLVPKVTFSGELVNDTIRACAGGVDDHANTDFQYRAHTRKVDLLLTLDDKPLKDTAFTLEFEGNKGHDYGDGRDKKMAQLHNANEPFDTDHPWKETLDVTSDKDTGIVSIWVLSSDVICQPTLRAVKKFDPNQDPVKLGETGCDFAAPISFRHFDDAAGNDPGDSGWLFYFPGQNGQLKNDFLASPGNTMPAKIYMKFDTKDGHWQYVNGHNMSLTISSVKLSDSSDATGSSDTSPPGSDNSNVDVPNDAGSDASPGDAFANTSEDASATVSPDAAGGSSSEVTDTSEIKKYVLFKNNNSLSIDSSTSADGSTQRLMVAKSKIQDAATIMLDAVDNNVWSQ